MIDENEIGPNRENDETANSFADQFGEVTDL